MCGIAGVWHPDGDLEATVRAMTSSISHRGPDADGHELFPADGLALGHRRLSIVDLSPTGAQPMYSRSGRYCVVFNGEIYNHRALRQGLLAEGYAFRGTSDTEVMLALVEADGIAATVSRLAGMFAIALWDAKERCLWIVRDRMGEKPLYFGVFGGTFAFASELKALNRLSNAPSRVNASAVMDIVQRGFVRGDKTIFTDVHKVRPGAMMSVRMTGAHYTMKAECYWSIPAVLTAVGRQSACTDVEAVDQLDGLLQRVIGDETCADVPVGAFLSGGIDSSLIVSVMQSVSASPINSFTVAFDDARYDESGYAAAIAAHLGTQHTTIKLQANDALDFITRLPQIFDEPFADPSQLPTLLVCQATRRHVAVALSGDGGDELFGGYSQYHSRDSIGTIAGRVPAALVPMVAAGTSLLPERLVGRLQRGGEWPVHSRARMVSALRARGDQRAIFESLLSTWPEPADVLSKRLRVEIGQDGRADVPWPTAATPQEAKMAYDMQTYLPDDILVKVDRSAMAFSLETRAPLLDHRVVEFALNTPFSQKIREGQGKWLLREVLKRYVPPALWERPKQGFGLPLAGWLRTDMRDWVEATLTDDTLLREWFDVSMVQRLWSEHLAGRNHASRLWPVLIVLQWLRQGRVDAGN